MNRTALLLGLLAVVTLAIVLVAPAGEPVQVSYVDSDSMAPTLEPGDAYILVPAGDVSTGDIVTFWAPNRGEFVTHRVVGETEDGYLTTGDANERTDQATGSEPVPREVVVGAVWTVAGEPVVVPAAGAVVPTLDRFQPLLFGLVLLAARRSSTR